MEIRQMRVACDFCALPGDPTWRYDVPPKTVIMITKDTKTGEVEKILSHGQMGSCDDCDKILQSKIRFRIPHRIAARMGKSEVFEGLTPQQRARGLAGWVRQLKRIVPLLRNRRPSRQGEDPMDGLGLFSES